jgi:hypothetical protein
MITSWARSRAPSLASRRPICGPGCRGFKSHHSPEYVSRPKAPVRKRTGAFGLAGTWFWDNGLPGSPKTWQTGVTMALNVDSSRALRSSLELAALVQAVLGASPSTSQPGLSGRTALTSAAGPDRCRSHARSSGLPTGLFSSAIWGEPTRQVRATSGCSRTATRQQSNRSRCTSGQPGPTILWPHARPSAWLRCCTRRPERAGPIYHTRMRDLPALRLAIGPAG